MDATRLLLILLSFFLICFVLVIILIIKAPEYIENNEGLMVPRDSSILAKKHRKKKL